MAFDFITVSAISSEYERNFSSYAKITTPRAQGYQDKCYGINSVLKTGRDKGQLS
jgi:hypothetical protein